VEPLNHFAHSRTGDASAAKDLDGLIGDKVGDARALVFEEANVRCQFARHLLHEILQNKASSVLQLDKDGD
jgi:hypothetical protein